MHKATQKSGICQDGELNNDILIKHLLEIGVKKENWYSIMFPCISLIDVWILILVITQIIVFVLLAQFD